MHTYSGKLCFSGLCAAGERSVRRGRGNNLRASPALTGPLPFGVLFVKMESRLAPQETLSKSTRHTGIKFSTQGPKSEPERDFFLGSNRVPKWVPKR